MTAGTRSSLASRLLAAVDELADEITARIRADDSAYVESGLLTVGQLRSAVRDNVVDIMTALGDGGLDTEAAAAAGRLKAEQGIPIDSLLHAYRLGGIVSWERLMALAAADGDTDSLVPMASRLWAIIDTCSGAATEAYHARADKQLHRDQMSHNLLMAELLDRPSDDDTRATELIRELGLPTNTRYLVLAADATDDDRLPDSGTRLARAGIASAWTVQQGRHFAVVALGPRSDMSTIATMVGESARTRVGASRAHPARSLSWKAKRQAIAAQRCLPAGSGGVHVYGTDPIALLVTAARDVAADISADVLARLDELPVPARTGLLDTLQAWFDAKGSTGDAAKLLHCHRNTVLYRLNQVAELTGRSVFEPRGSAELYIALSTTRLGGD
ncbi:helix-turn-helix domain-containing protein [Umezawaea sp. Da 62-37]|uniref:PucR family transcriptional regulator n=1 Tax=Umezawaea sp. Da 62-37 TaxID=3075927 RepID=UPI0028F6D35E|nr:helix-turn-helix domain-containing protein [Umezawaea sp. Da 62-37]WNV85245.1 helix-turn-helix domain-containing protein [Umezawaea sp. Da 62-37]